MGGTGFEPVTYAMSTRRSTAELTARVFPPLAQRTLHVSEFDFELHDTTALQAAPVDVPVARSAYLQASALSFLSDWDRVLDRPHRRVRK